MRHTSLGSRRVRSQRVLVRAGLDVPVEGGGGVADAFRLERSLPTLRWLIARKAKVVLLSHRGQPHGSVVPSLSLKPVAKALAQMLKHPVGFVALNKVAYTKAVECMKPGDVLCLENLRFDCREEGAAMSFARELASVGDLYVNDDFSTSHRPHASIALLPQLLPHVAGFNLSEDLRMLDALRSRPRHPFLAVIGGGKVCDKLGTVKRLLPLVDHILLGGAAASTMLKARGCRVGRSLVDATLSSKELNGLARSKKLVTPVDVVVAANATSIKGRVVSAAFIPKSLAAFDLGPATIKGYALMLAKARTVFWAGPVGYAENPIFAQGTRKLARALSPRKTFAVIGGGDSLRAIRAGHCEKHFSFLSTGGGAMLQYLAGKKLPGLAALAQ